MAPRRAGILPGLLLILAHGAANAAGAAPLVSLKIPPGSKQTSELTALAGKLELAAREMAARVPVELGGQPGKLGAAFLSGRNAQDDALSPDLRHPVSGWRRSGGLGSGFASLRAGEGDQEEREQEDPAR